MTATTVHIINHTHWDREWFLTSIYTSAWIPGLIDKIEQLAAGNPDFTFLLDGQTLVIEDLLQLAPEYEPTVRRLVEQGHLLIGPYYCQPDWQLTGGELLLRNLLYGRQDMERYGGRNEAGWLVDTFGHIAQAPQLHRLFGLEAIYVWRGVPQMVPYFLWKGSDGQSLFTINLFGGYRNLYGVTHAPEVAVTRLEAEVEKLREYYPDTPIPLFDGYDLEEDPEDPMTFYREEIASLPPDIHLEESSPPHFARQVRAQLDDLPTLSGELNSGKYGATFPGTFSARTYLKVMQRDCDQALFQLAEPLAVMAMLRGRTYPAARFEGWARRLLQNAVHDCICGVSIDQVHEKMEVHYRAVWDGVWDDIELSLAAILRGFPSGRYALSTSPFPHEGWHAQEEGLYRVRTEGIGVWPLGEPMPIERPQAPVEQFEWRNEHYAVTVHADGTVWVEGMQLGALFLVEEQGDTYSEEMGHHRTLLQSTTPPVVEERSAKHCVLGYECDIDWRGVHLSATVRLTLDQGPLLRWEVVLDSRGTNFRVEMLFQTPEQGELYAGMPFDVVERAASDTDLLPRQLPPELARFLLGQREVEAVHTFPFHDFVAVSCNDTTLVILAKGLHAYRTEEAGHLALTLRRSVEWLTAAELPHRVGDAGPFFYVPDARCERRVRHEIAAYVGRALDEMAVQRLNAGFQNPPLLVEAEGRGSEREWAFLQEDLPLSSLHRADGKVCARFFNPTTQERELARSYQPRDLHGVPGSPVTTISPKQILTVELEPALPERSMPGQPSDRVDQIVRLLGAPEWRVGENQGRPDPEVIAQLREQATELEARLAEVEAELDRARGREKYLLRHRYYIIKRELYEFLLSIRLNEMKLADQGRLADSYLFTPDEEVARLGQQLNRLRIQRRIYDYIVEAV